MPPLAHLAVPLVLGVGLDLALAVGGLIWLRACARRRGGSYGRSPVVERLLRDSRFDGVRYEVQVADWGPDHDPADMRYRWTVLDADRGLRTELYEAPSRDPDGEMGAEVPYLVGNAPTFELALGDALAYVLAQPRAHLVVTPGGM